MRIYYTIMGLFMFILGVYWMSLTGPGISVGSLWAGMSMFTGAVYLFGGYHYEP